MVALATCIIVADGYSIDGYGIDGDGGDDEDANGLGSTTKKNGDDAKRSRKRKQRQRDLR